MAIRAFLIRLFGRRTTEGERADGQPASAYEGQLLRGNRTAPVYKIEDGRKRWIVTEEIFLRHGFAWADVRVVPKATVDNILSGDNIT